MSALNNMQRRFYIMIGGRRTSITVDTVLFELMALKLSCRPDSQAAYSTVRKWLQQTLIEHLGNAPGRKSASQWARVYLIEAIADPTLSEKRWDWKLAETG